MSDETWGPGRERRFEPRETPRHRPVVEERDGSWFVRCTECGFQYRSWQSDFPAQQARRLWKERHGNEPVEFSWEDDDVLG